MEGELDEGSQNVQAFSYKVNKYQGCNVQHDKHNEQCCMLHMKVVNRVNPKKAKIFFYFFNFVFICHDKYSLTYCGHHFMMYVSQIVMLYTLNLYSVVC